MKYFIILMFSLLSGCTCIDYGAQNEAFKKNCPYELEYSSGHYLHVPITITPHKMTYKIGDTIRISTIFSDSIYDLSTHETFKIEKFPFKPITQLYRFYNGIKWDAGYRVNELHIDSSYNSVYNYSSHYADGFKSYTIYKDDMYYFEYYIVLLEKGRYIMNMVDLYQNHIGSGNTELNAEANAITFEGKCPTLNYRICNIIKGDNHLEDFVAELFYLDKEVYYDHLGTLEGSLGPLKAGGITVEFSGFFGFEVVE